MTTALIAETYAAPDPRTGVCVADGYGIRIAVERRHLIVSDGLGAHRRERRYPKVGHGIERLVVIGHAGTISLDALRWMDRTGIVFTHIDTDGTLLTASAHPTIDNARLRRAQALAHTTPAGLAITRTILDAKLGGQARVAATHLDNPATADRIDGHRVELVGAGTLAECREIEAAAAAVYFAAWPDRVALTFATKDHPRVPDHWTRYAGRRSPLSNGASQKAADPLNAILNYLYALAEIECRNACLRLGLDPGVGILHADTPRRDSLALDLIEVVRPTVDAWVIDLADGHTFRRADFHETDDGHCRILAPLTHHLAHTLPTWAQAVAPWAETVAHQLADTSPTPIRKATPLTATNRKASSIASSAPRRKTPAPVETGSRQNRSARRPLGPVCADCGIGLDHPQRTYCPDCWPAHRTEAARTGTTRAAALATDPDHRSARGSAIASGKKAALDRAATEHGLHPDDWSLISPRVQALTLAEIMAATGLGIAHASRIRTGKAVPHPRHWAALSAAALPGAATPLDARSPAVPGSQRPNNRRKPALSEMAKSP